MRPDITWRDIVQKTIMSLNSLFITRQGFESKLLELLRHPSCKLVGIKFEIDSDKPFKIISIGTIGKGTGKEDVRTFTIDDNRKTTCRISVWRDGSSAIEDDTWVILEELFKSYWKPNLRTESAGMIDLKRENDAKVIAQQTLESLLAQGLPCSVLFCDLDNFKPVNDNLGKPEGNRIIKEFGAILEDITISSAVLLHNGGDEFVVLLPDGSPENAVLIAINTRMAVDQYDFQTKGNKMGISIGLHSTAIDKNIVSFDELLSKANVSLDKYAKKPTKGKIRFNEDTLITLTSTDLANNLDRAQCVIKSMMLSRKPFSNVWLNCLSNLIADAVSQNKKITSEIIKYIVDDFIKWTAISISQTGQIKASRARDDEFDIGTAITAIDIAFAIAHGLFQASTGLESVINDDVKLNFDEKLTNASIVLSNGMVLWSFIPGDGLDRDYLIGKFWRLSHGVSNLLKENARAILIQIGHDKLNIPLSIFAEKIVVDDRPTFGGGLPDFWEATIARLIAHITNNPNICMVYILGNYENAARTIERLRQVSAWNTEVEKISYKTGMTVSSINRAAELLKDKIHFPNNEEELIAHLASELRSAQSIQPISQYKSFAERETRFLKFDLRMDDMALKREDGCRVKTIAEAFPVVLEIARQTIGEEIVKDQAGQVLRELIDFKVHLTNPTSDKIPAFYMRDKDSLDNYFNQEFVSKSGKFGSAFDKNSQLDAVITHIVRSIEDYEKQFATRRAILVVPHEIKDKDKVSPLGLISIRIIPRFLQNRVRLHYSYTWRTVESLVGFPYSLYGSVRYSEHLTELIRKRLEPANARRLEMADVSYIAHSLHIFMDDYGQNIARRIVDDASF